ncbi:MAG: ferrous iron transport protein A [Firmicutes bacterium]|nr:ferrous iron transport protein A [Alicyclobacillaceae bacterium]MCL6497356.1 ferrous iron transport protein A [Bacillota bacterium]
MRLDEVPVGKTVVVRSIADARLRLEALRLGIAAGTVLQVTARVPRGPVVVRGSSGPLALGREWARQVCVRPADILEDKP